MLAKIIGYSRNQYINFYVYLDDIHFGDKLENRQHTRCYDLEMPSVYHFCSPEHDIIWQICDAFYNDFKDEKYKSNTNFRYNIVARDITFLAAVLVLKYDWTPSELCTTFNEFFEM